MCAWFFGDSFDLYSTITDCGTYWDAAFGPTASLALSATGRFAGSRGITTTSSSITPHITKTSGANDAVHHVVLAIQQPVTLSGTTPYLYLTLFDGTTAQCSIGFRSDGAIILTSGAPTGTTLATYAGAIAAINTWYAFEIEVVIHNTAGSISVRRNGNTSNDFALGSLNTRNSANNYANKIGVGSNTFSPTQQIIDDLLWRSDASSVPWVGDIRCFTRMPASDASVAWSKSSATLSVYYNTSSTYSQGPAANTIWFFSVQTPYSGPVTALSANLTSAVTGHLNMALYDATGAPASFNGQGAVPSGGPGPGTLLATATPLTNPAAALLTFTLGTPVNVTKNQYLWVAIIGDVGCSISGNLSGVSAPQLSYTYSGGAFPATGAGVVAGTPRNGFSYLGVLLSATNSSLVSEAQQDGATTYVYSSTVSQSDLYGIAAIGSTPSSIVGVTTRGYFEKSDAGTRNVAVQLQSGATNVQSASTALNTTWGWVSRNDLVDPATGSAWTAVGVNNATIGAVVTA